MSLALFEIKLKEIEFKLEKAREAFKYNAEIVLQELKTLDPNNPRRNIFAKYDFILKESLYRIKTLTNELSIYSNHRAIIVDKNERIKRALEMFNNLEDKVIDLLTTLQAMAIFLENLKKEL